MVIHQQIDRDNDYYNKVIGLNGRHTINPEQLKQSGYENVIRPKSKRPLFSSLVVVGLGLLAWNTVRRKI